MISNKIKAFQLKPSMPKEEPTINPHLSKSLKIHKNGGEKSVSATKTLKPGDLVAVTKSFSNVYCQPYRRPNCSHCGNRISVKIPCDSCVYSTFCSEECKIAAMKGFHSIECPLLSACFLLDEPDIHLALKSTFKALEVSEGKSLLNDSDYTSFDWKDNDGEDDFNILKAILNTRKAKLNFIDLLGVTFRFIAIFDKLKQLDAFNNFTAKFENGEKMFAKMFFQIYPISKMNNFSSDYKFNLDGFFGNITHSCKPNVVIFHDSKTGLNNYVAFKEIKTGEKLTVCLGGTDYYSKSKIERKEFIQHCYGFECRCEACQKSFPMERWYLSVLTNLYKDMNRKKEKGTFKELIKEFIKPTYNYPTRNMLFEVLFYFHLGYHNLYRKDSMMNWVWKFKDDDFNVNFNYSL
ncbi:hypothetical protein ACFFRR_011231 [Megaselia abdita]